MAINPGLTNGFGYACWCFGPAIVYYHRNSPGAAQIAIENLGQNALNWMRQLGGPVDLIQHIRDEYSCMNAASNVQNWLDRIFNSDPLGRTQFDFFKLGLALGKAWTYCRPDGAQPNEWPNYQSLANQEIGQAQAALGAFPKLNKQFERQLTSMGFVIMRAETYPSSANQIDTQFTGLFSSIPKAFLEGGP
jgi:hypothetical protein